jgi:hypothetical protein
LSRRRTTRARRDPKGGIETMAAKKKATKKKATKKKAAKK